MNRMKEIANMLGVEIGERFCVSNKTAEPNPAE